MNMNCLGRRAVGGESPVMVSLVCCRSILSRGELVKLPLNLPAPSGKAKYYQETDSERVL